MITLSVTSRSSCRLQTGLGQRGGHDFGQVPARELHRGGIHGHVDAPISGVPPQLTLMAGIPQHAGADGHDQAALLRDGNQNRRRDASEFRIVPTQQRFKPGDAPRGEVELRLVMDGQFIALQGVMQFRFDGQAAVGVLADFRVGQLDAALARPFGCIQARCRRRAVARRFGAIPRIDRDTDAGAQEDLVALHRKRRREGRQNALGHAHGVVRPVYVAENQHETVAAAARQSLGFAQTAG